MGKKSGSPAPAPDPAIGQAAAANAAVSKEWLDFSKEQFAKGELRQDDYDQLIKQVTASDLKSQQQALEWAGEDRAIQERYRKKYDTWANEDRALGRATKAELDGYASDALATGKGYAAKFNGQASNQFGFADKQQGRYNDTFSKVEDRIAQDAMTWDSKERLAQEAGKAKADVIQGAAAQKAANDRSMAAMGIDPRSGRHAGIDRATGLSTALAAAGAQNVARDNVRSQGIQLRGQAAQVGQQVLGSGQQARSLGVQATQSAHTAEQAGVSQAMQAKNLGLSAAGVGNTAAQLGMGNQGAGYQGINTGINAGQSAVGAAGAGNANFYQNGSAMAQGFGREIGRAHV